MDSINNVDSNYEVFSTTIYEDIQRRNKMFDENHYVSKFSYEDNYEFVMSQVLKFKLLYKFDSKKDGIENKMSDIENALYLIHSQTDLTTSAFKMLLKSMGVCLKTFEIFGSIESLREALDSNIDLQISRFKVKIRAPKLPHEYDDSYMYSSKTFKKYTSMKYLRHSIAKKRMYKNKKEYEYHTRLIYPYLSEFLIHLDPEYENYENDDEYYGYDD